MLKSREEFADVSTATVRHCEYVSTTPVGYITKVLGKLLKIFGRC